MEWFAALTQGYFVVTEYSGTFHTLSSRGDLREEHITVGRFKSGLRKAFHDLMTLSSIHSMADAYQVALNAGRLLHNNNVTPLSPFMRESISVDTSSENTPSSCTSITITTTSFGTVIVRLAISLAQFFGQCYNCQQHGYRVTR